MASYYRNIEEELQKGTLVVRDAVAEAAFMAEAAAQARQDNEARMALLRASTPDCFEGQLRIPQLLPFYPPRPTSAAATNHLKK